jgi:hypothetical protein
MTNLRPRGADPIAIIETLSGISEGLGEWVAGPTPDNGIAAAIQQRYRDQCDAYSNAPGWMKAFSTPSRVTMSNICDPWLESQGSGGPVLEVPFSGGQCSTIYRVFLTVRRVSDDVVVIGPDTAAQNPSQNNQNAWPGPIQAVFARRNPSNPSRWGWAVTDATGETFGTLSVSSEVYVAGVTLERLDGQPDNCGDPPGEPAPNPNPRPDPGLDPEDEPFEDPEGRPITPMPGIENPWGDPIQLPNFPLPDLFGEDEGSGNNPNVGPPVEPGTEQTGDGVNGEDDDFPEPPDGSIYVGFIVKMSDQGVSEGLQVNSPPEPIYRATTGNYRAIYEVDGNKVYSTPKRIEAETSVYWLDLPGLTLTGARVNVPSNDSYTVTPLYQAETESEPQEV